MLYSINEKEVSGCFAIRTLPRLFQCLQNGAIVMLHLQSDILVELDKKLQRTLYLLKDGLLFDAKSTFDSIKIISSANRQQLRRDGRGRQLDGLLTTYNGMLATLNRTIYICATIYTQIENLLSSSKRSNPRGFDEVARKMMLWGEFYSKKGIPAGFLSPEQIPSHVDAAVETDMMIIRDIPQGAIIAQAVRPNGFMGQYWYDPAAEPPITPSGLGASEYVGDVTQIPPIRQKRVTVKCLVLDNLPAGISTAKAVWDTWSIKGEVVDTKGGDEQIYMPLSSDEKQQKLVVILENDADPSYIDAVRAIAKKNNLQVMPQVEALRCHGIPGTLRPNSRSAVIFDWPMNNEFLDNYISTTLTKVSEGRNQEAISYISRLIQQPTFDASTKLALTALRGALNYLEGRMSDANKDLASNKNVKKYSNMIAHYNALALFEMSPSKSVELLDELLAKEKTSLRLLDIGILLNRLSAQYSDDIGWDDFGPDGSKTNVKTKFAERAEAALFNALSNNNLAEIEHIIALTELGFAQRKQRKYNSALRSLLDAEMKINDFLRINDLSLSVSLKRDMELQLGSIRLGIALSLSRTSLVEIVNSNLNSGVSEVLHHAISRLDRGGYRLKIATYLERILPQIEAHDIMTTRMFFKRWLGNNINDLFITGWLFSGLDSGSGLINVYRKAFPIEMSRICEQLINNEITELDLAYLANTAKDDEFKQLVDAISKNSSLKKLALREFSDKKGASSAGVQVYDRVETLFNALSHANRSSGQALEFFDYSKTSMNSVNGIDACLRYLANHTHSMKILRPALYGLHESNLNKFGNIIARLKSLQTLILGLTNTPGGGQILANAVQQNRNNGGKLNNLYPYPGEVQPYKGDTTARDNNVLLHDCANELFAHSNTHSWATDLGSSRASSMTPQPGNTYGGLYRPAPTRQVAGKHIPDGTSSRAADVQIPKGRYCHLDSSGVRGCFG